MAQAIPASQIVAVTPSVLSAGGNALDMNGLLLDNSTRIPIGSVLSFPTAASVSDYFGASSDITALAGNYFLGFDNSTRKPGALLIAQYNEGDVGAYLRGGDVSGLTLAELQDLTGVLTVTIDGTAETSSSIDLATATSFSDAAEMVSVALGVLGPQTAAFTASIASTTMTVTAIGSGTIGVGQEVQGAGVTAGTLISAQLTGTTGGTGTYTVTESQTVTSGARTANIPAVTYDSVSGAFVVISSTDGASSTIGFGSGTIAAGLKLTSATGAVTSQGADATTPSEAMTLYAQLTQNWATFMTAFDPDPSGNANKLLFAAWTNSANPNRYAYIAWDTDSAPAASAEATSSLGYLLGQSNSSGTVPIYSPTQGPQVAAFVMGTAASIDFTQLNGRITFAFKSQTGLDADVVTATAAENLQSNGYNYYGRWSTANDEFVFLRPGSVTGTFLWLDGYINQIWMNNQFQLALMVLLTSARSIPYNRDGYGLIIAAVQDVINQALTFGAVRPGVTLSASQAAQVNQNAGVEISGILNTQGWYFQVRDALPQVRAARESPPCTFWYMDGGSVQQLALSSISVL